MLIAGVILTWTACLRPNWFLAVLVATPVLLEMIITGTGGDIFAISLGSLTIRPADPGTVGLLIGILYHGRSEMSRLLGRQPGGTVLKVLLLFLGLKIAATITLDRALIASNALSNGLGGGLVAAIGEVRDSFLGLLVPVYVIVAGRRLVASQMIKPFAVAVAVIFFKAILLVATGKALIWGGDLTGTEQDRFISSSEAITLLLFAFVFFFVPAAKGKRPTTRVLAWVAVGVSLLANHRSVWLAGLLGMVTLVWLAVAGRLAMSKRRRIQLACLFAGSVVAVAVLLMHHGSEMSPASNATGINTRLLALTDPANDPTSSWRMQLWQSRLEQTQDDWAFGRVLGDRPLTMMNGALIGVPDHSAYISGFEIGGVCLTAIVIAFWGVLTREGIKTTATPGLSYPSGAVALAIIAASVGYGVAYDFPLIGPALATMLLLRRRVVVAQIRQTECA